MAEDGEDIDIVLSPFPPSHSIAMASPRIATPGATPSATPRSASNEPVTFTKGMADQISAIASFLGKLDPLAAEKKKKDGDFIFTKENILKDLHGLYGFECIKIEKIKNRETLEDKDKLYVEFTVSFDKSWLQDPVVSEEDKVISPEETIGFFKPDVKMPLADRFFTPTLQEDKEQAGFISCVPSKCQDNKLQAFFEAPPLVKNQNKISVSSIPYQWFSNITQFHFYNKPFFHIPENHSRHSLKCNSVAISLLQGLLTRASFWDTNWEKKINLDGTESVFTLADNFSKNDMKNEFSIIRKATRLAIMSIDTACDLNKATIAASRNKGRSLVLENCQNNPSASNTKSQLKSSSFNSPGLFGPISRDLAIKFKTPNHNLSLSFKKKGQNRNFYNDDTNEGASSSQSQKRQLSYGGNQFKKGKPNYTFFHEVNPAGYSHPKGNTTRPGRGRGTHNTFNNNRGSSKNSRGGRGRGNNNYSKRGK